MHEFVIRNGSVQRLSKETGVIEKLNLACCCWGRSASQRLSVVSARSAVSWSELMTAWNYGAVMNCPNDTSHSLQDQDQDQDSRAESDETVSVDLLVFGDAVKRGFGDNWNLLQPAASDV